MSREATFTVQGLAAIPSAERWMREMIVKGLRGGPVVVALKRPKRTLDQNAKLWPMLTDISRQVEWYGQKLNPYEWKDVLTAALKKQKAVPGIDGGLVMIGAHTSQMTKEEMSDLLEVIYAFGAEKGVKWSEPEKAA